VPEDTPAPDGAQEPPAKHDPPATHGSQTEALLRILEEGEVREASDLPMEYRFLDEKLKLQEIELKREYAKQEIELRSTYAKGLLLILAAMLVVVNVIFWKYAATGRHWNIPPGVIQVWLGATVVQVVGVVTVVTKYLFPNRDIQPEPPAPPQLPPA
jgi:hypothetical protein